MLGLIFGSTNILIDIGILMFSLAVLFQLVTLPVEFNASARALQLLESEGFLYGDENRQARKVLSAAGHDICCGSSHSNFTAFKTDLFIWRKTP